MVEVPGIPAPSSGGGYHGPGDTIPHAQPTDPGQPGQPGIPGGDPGVPSPKSPDDPAGGSPTPGPGGDGLQPEIPTAPPGVTSDPLTSFGVPQDLTSWTWWWELNKEPYLVLPAKLDPTRPRTGNDEDLLGEDLRGLALGVRPSDATLFGQVVPALLRTLDQDHPDRLLGATAIALARIGAARPPESRGSYSEVLRKRAVGASQALTESVLLSLGILGDTASAPFLVDVMLSTRDGRQALGTTRIPPHSRAFAAYALGLIGHATDNEDVRRYVVHQLVWCLETDRSASVELDAACIGALGLVPVGDTPTAPVKRGNTPPPGSSLSAQVEYLLDLLEQRRRDSRVRAQIPIALGRLLQDADGPSHEALRTRTIDEIIDRIAAHRREPRELIQSSVIALGLLADSDADDVDRRARGVLLRVADLVNDIASRQFALIAIGRVLNRPGDGAVADKSEEHAYLLHALGRGSTLLRPWAAIALGIGTRNQEEADSVRPALRHALGSARVDLDIGAHAIALGLARDSDGVALLVETLGSGGDQVTRGRVALALGLCGESAGRSALLEVLPTATFQPALLHDSAVALELLGAGEVVPHLVDMLSTAGSFASQGSVALALARSKDQRGIGPILRLFSDTGASTAARTLAASALGSLGDRNHQSRSALYAVDSNLHAAPEALFSASGGGILNHAW